MCELQEVCSEGVRGGGSFRVRHYAGNPFLRVDEPGVAHLHGNGPQSNNAIFDLGLLSFGKRRASAEQGRCQQSVKDVAIHKRIVNHTGERLRPRDAPVR